jgi:hypothetical protein
MPRALASDVGRFGEQRHVARPRRHRREHAIVEPEQLYSPCPHRQLEGDAVEGPFHRRIDVEDAEEERKQ